MRNIAAHVSNQCKSGICPVVGRIPAQAGVTFSSQKELTVLMEAFIVDL